MGSYTADFIEGLPAAMRKEVGVLSADIDRLKKERHDQGLAINVKKEEAALAKLLKEKEDVIAKTREESATILAEAKEKAEVIIDKASISAKNILDLADKKYTQASEEKNATTQMLDHAAVKNSDADERLKVAESKEMALGIKQINFEKRIKDTVDFLSKI